MLIPSSFKELVQQIVKDSTSFPLRRFQATQTTPPLSWFFDLVFGTTSQNSVRIQLFLEKPQATFPPHILGIKNYEKFYLFLSNTLFCFNGELTLRSVTDVATYFNASSEAGKIGWSYLMNCNTLYDVLNLFDGRNFNVHVDQLFPAYEIFELKSLTFYLKTANKTNVKISYTSQEWDDIWRAIKHIPKNDLKNTSVITCKTAEESCLIENVIKSAPDKILYDQKIKNSTPEKYSLLNNLISGCDLFSLGFILTRKNPFYEFKQ